MLAVFCMRLALGTIACLLLLSPTAGGGPRPLVNSRFYRTHFLTVLALTCLALLFTYETAGWPVRTALGIALALAFLGSVSWSLEGAPGGAALIVLTLGALLAALTLHALAQSSTPARALLGGLTSAAFLGAALTAMLLGHSYLIAPAMSIAPLMRLLAALAITLTVRAVGEGWALACWTSEHSLGTLEGDVALWLPVRWCVGLLAPLLLTWMAWQTARIRSTQSATGIFYVVVIFCFLGELIGLLLRPSGVTL